MPLCSRCYRKGRARIIARHFLRKDDVWKERRACLRHMEEVEREMWRECVGTEYIALRANLVNLWESVEEMDEEREIQRLVREIFEEFKKGEVVPSVQIPEDLAPSVLALAELQGKETLAIMAAYEEIEDVYAHWEALQRWLGYYKGLGEGS